MSRKWWHVSVRRLLIVSPILVGVTYLVVFLLGRPEPNYTRIDDDLYQGGLVSSPPWRTDAVLNLCEQSDSYTRETYAWEPIPDAAPAPSLAWLRERVDWIDTQHQSGKRVYVHCYAGVSRSGMVVVAYLMKKHRWSRDETLEYVRSRRPITRPNPAFMELLLEWEKVVLSQ